MTTKKAVIIIVSIILALILLVLIFVGAIFGIAIYSIGNSEAATTAKAYLKKNETLKRDIGEVKDFGAFVTGNVSIEDSSGNATVNLKVIGEKKTVNAAVVMEYRKARRWYVTDASYTGDDGKPVELLDKYGPPLPESSETPQE